MITDQKFTLDQLLEILKARFGDDFVIAQREFGDGSSQAVLTFEGKLRASWRAQLVNMPPRDGVTPRGPKEYYDLKFYP